MVDECELYPRDWQTRNEGPGAWIELAVENGVEPAQLSMLAITPSNRKQDYLNEYDLRYIPKQVLASFSDGSVQVLNFDCSVNTQNFFVNKTSTNIKLTFQSMCNSSFSSIPGFGEVKAFSNKSTCFIFLLLCIKFFQLNTDIFIFTFVIYLFIVGSCDPAVHFSYDRSTCRCKPGFIGVGGSPPCLPLTTSVVTASGPVFISPLKRIILKVSSLTDLNSLYPSSNIVDGSLLIPWMVDRLHLVPAIELLLDRKRVVSRLKITPVSYDKFQSFHYIASLVLIEFDDSSATYLQFDCTSDTQTFFLGKLTARLKMTILKACNDNFIDISTYVGLGEVVAYEGGINN